MDIDIDYDNIKRKRSDIIKITIWLVLFILWYGFLIYWLFNVYNFTNPPVLILLFILPTSIFTFGLFYDLKKNAYIETREFLIHRYEEWLHSKSTYETRYLIEEVKVYKKFIYYKNVGCFEYRMSGIELKKKCMAITEDEYIFDKRIYTMDGAMRKIIELVKKNIKQNKTNDVGGITVRNIHTKESLDYEDVKGNYENGDYENIMNNEK